MQNSIYMQRWIIYWRWKRLDALVFVTVLADMSVLTRLFYANGGLDNVSGSSSSSRSGEDRSNMTSCVSLSEQSTECGPQTHSLEGAWNTELWSVHGMDFHTLAAGASRPDANIYGSPWSVRGSRPLRHSWHTSPRTTTAKPRHCYWVEWSGVGRWLHQCHANILQFHLLACSTRRCQCECTRFKGSAPSLFAFKRHLRHFYSSFYEHTQRLRRYYS